MVLLANSALSASQTVDKGSTDKRTTGLSAESILQGIDAVEVSRLPLIWQQISNRKATVGHGDPDFLVALAQLFYTKATDQSPEVFQQKRIQQKRIQYRGEQQRSEQQRGEQQNKGEQQNSDFHSFYASEASETLEFFGHDFVKSAYPDFDLALETASAQDGADRVVTFVREVFNDLGYALPASFYRMLLCPIERDSIHEARPMFFDPQMQGVKRAYDACLHGFNVTAMLMRVQAHASAQGLLIQHGCGCDHSLAQLIPGRAKVSFEFESAQGKQKALTAYLWRCWNEYLLFPLGVHAHTLAL
ncbi:MAG: hypothetical protein AAFY33_19470 [Cyanobacteria bacterium J06643_4]